jgi:hypothetical protein
MGETFTEAQGLLFADMDARAREVVEKKFRVRLDSAQSSENQQAAWEVYQNATLKLIKAIGSGVTFGDAKGYAATVARNSCRDYWRVYNPGWADLKGRLSRFFRKQPMWALWETPVQLGWICGPANWNSQGVAPGSRVSALLEKPRSIRSNALPKREVVAELDSTAWDTLLKGIFEYLRGPVRLDDVVSICGVLFGVKGSREMAFEEMMTDDEGRAWDPPAPAPRPDVALAIREQLVKLWSEVKTMPKRWVLPFLLNPPVMKGGTARKPRNRVGEGEEPERADRGEVAVFTANGIATVAEMEALIGFTAQQYTLLWRELDVRGKGGPALEAVMEAKLRFAVIWNLLPLDDGLIAKIMELDGAQKVINLRMVARTHLAKTLVDSGIPEKRGGGY